MKFFLLILSCVVAVSLGGAATITEDFSADPLQNGWRMFGNTNLFQWDSTNQNLAVTWDSSQTNSYFYQPLGTILARDDSFHLSFDLVFQNYEIGGYSFPAAIGFLNLSNATQTNFSRGAGVNSIYGARNLMEFDFFPAFGSYSPTIAQTIVATNYNFWLYNHNNQIDMTPGQWFHVELNYTATNRTLTTVVTNNGTQYGGTQTILVPTNFDFRCTAVAISSYSDQHATGSILAHGTIDNFSVSVPPSPVQNVTGAFSNHVWQTQFTGRTNWLYTLERTTNFISWNSVLVLTNFTGTSLLLQDSNAPMDNAFYRIRADRP